MIANEFNLSMSFAENIGICEMSETLVDGPVIKIRKYNLLRYNNK